jgi:tetratricopeptide (TPR) repeat protein
VLERRDPLHRWWHDLFRAASLIGEGHFSEGSSVAMECLALEQQLNAGPPLGFAAVMFALWCAQGQRHAFEGLAGTLRMPTHVARSVHQCMVAYVARELEREAEARAEFEQLAANDFDTVRDESWAMCMHELAEVCAFLGDSERAKILLRILAPYEARMVTGMAGTIFGPVSHDLAILEATRGQWNTAERHFEHALEMNRRMHARPWLARTQYEYARMLLARDDGGRDPERARALLDEALATTRELDMPMLEERALGVGGRVSPEASTPKTFPDTRHPTPDTLFRREGQYWTVAYAGQVVRLKDSKGVQYLARLLSHPAQEILALDLVQENGAPQPQRSDNGGLEALDPQAKNEYRQRLRELREELTEAEQSNDLGRAGKLKQELEFLAQQLNAAVDLHGKDRKVGAATERARLMVTKRVKSVLKTLDALHPPLAHHLRACVKTGYYCVYTPPPGEMVAWQTSE